MRQGLAVRGHTNEEGNLYQLLKCGAQEDPEIQSWLRGKIPVTRNSK